MEIVSKFRDYYDSLRSFDRDDTPLYVRTTTEHRFVHGWRRGTSTGTTRDSGRTSSARAPSATTRARLRVASPKPISDELKAHAHGFDKQSFKKSEGAAQEARPKRVVIASSPR